MENKLISRFEITVKENPNKGILDNYSLEPCDQFTSSKEMCKVIRDIYRSDECCVQYKEYCYVLFFDRALHIIGYMKVSEGGTTSTVIDCKVIIKACLDCGASGIVLTHNHPSNNPRPGVSDLSETESLSKACSFFEINLIDHIILGLDRYYSFGDESVSLF